jgi:predicted ATPase
LPAKRRVQIHVEIGTAIEEVHKDDLKPHLAAPAHHFRAAGDAGKAIDYSIAAADAADAVFAYEDALSHVRPALAVAESHEHEGAQRVEVFGVLAISDLLEDSECTLEVSYTLPVILENDDAIETKYQLRFEEADTKASVEGLGLLIGIYPVHLGFRKPLSYAASITVARTFRRKS